MNHARQADCEIEIACRSDGTILGMRGEIFVDLGAYVRTNGLIAAAHPGASLHRSVPRAERADDLDGAADQQDAVRHLSRARPLRGVVLLRAADRTGGARSRDRQRRDAAAQSDRRRRKCRTGWPGWSRAARRSIPNATAAIIARRSTAALPSSAGRKSALCRAARSTAAITASPSPALSREAAPGRRRRRGSNWSRTVRCRCMSARPRSGRASKR